jgi:uncharacterized repeat protein (TIGR02543 family)
MIFFWNQSYNSIGTKEITINLTLETHMPVDEMVTIEFWKSGTENSPHEERTVPWYSGNASGRSYTIMTKVGTNQWQAIVDLDTTLVSANATSQSLYYYFYQRNTGNHEDKDIEFSRTGDISNTRKLDFGWHTKASLVQEDTLTAWFGWPTDGVMPTINTSTYLTTPPSDLNTTTFMAGGGMLDFWRGYFNPFIGNYLDYMVKDLNANWVMIVPGPKIIQFHPTVTVIRDHNINSMPEQDIIKVITEAHKRGLKVFWSTLAPAGEGSAVLDLTKVDAAWYVDYAKANRTEILWKATLAETHGVEMINFASFPTSQLKDEHLATIDSIAAVILSEVRAIYSGKIAVFWVNETPELEIYGKGDYLSMATHAQQLDAEGLTNLKDPSVSELLQPLRNRIGKLKAASTKYGKEVVLNGLDVASYDGMVGTTLQEAERHKEYTPDDPNYPLDLQEQSDVIEALRQVIAENSWIIGSYTFDGPWDVIWKFWNIRGKPASKVLAKWYRWRSPNNVHLTTSINDEATVKPFHKGGTLSLASGSYVLSKDTTVTVTASADDGYGFVKWTGDASGTSPTVTVSMDTDKAISAIFEIVNQSPVVAALSDTTMKEDESITVRLSATDEEGDAITFSAVPDTTLIVSVSSDTLTIAPKLNWHGVASVIVYASDGTSKGQTTFDITVTPVNDLPTAFEWVSSALDTINITQSNLAETYNIQWDASTDVDGDSINYLIYAKIGLYPTEEVEEITDTTFQLIYEEILENVFEGRPVNGATVSLNVKATDGIDTVDVTGENRVIYVNRYEYLSTEGEGIPTEFALHENYPNPFNPTTTLRFDLPEVSDVTLTIYNMLGQKVRTFNMQSTPAGYHSVKWNATNDYGDPVGAGVYLYQLQTKDFVKTRKMVLLK